MTLQTDLVTVPISVLNDELRVLLVADSKGGFELPSVTLSGAKLQRESIRDVAKSFFEDHAQGDVAKWMSTDKFFTRVVDVYDHAQDGDAGVKIVRLMGVPQDLTGRTKSKWLPVGVAMGSLNSEAQGFLKAAVDVVPFWARMTTLVFEILPPVFSIQDLRVMVSYLSDQDVDAGNFHRRLKRLDILKPLVSGQRVHKWEFASEKAAVVAREGLLP